MFADFISTVVPLYYHITANILGQTNTLQS